MKSLASDAAAAQLAGKGAPLSTAIPRKSEKRSTRTGAI